MIVSKSFTFDAGHRLSNYDGKCKNIHGHTYKVEVMVGCNKMDKVGMGIDFGELKRIFKEEVDKLFDHKLLLWEKDETNHRIANAIKNTPARESIVWTSYNPTAENMACHILGLFESRLQIDGLDKEGDVWIDSVRVYETPTSYAEAFQGDVDVELEVVGLKVDKNKKPP